MELNFTFSFVNYFLIFCLMRVCEFLEDECIDFEVHFCCAKIGNLNIDDLMIIVIHLAEQIQFSQNHLNKSVFFVTLSEI